MPGRPPYNVDAVDDLAAQFKQIAQRLASLERASAGGSVIVGEMKMWPGATIPLRYVACDGRLLNRVTYADLFAAIGTTWGAGDGTTTFAIPDLRGRAAIGVGTGTGLTARALGLMTGVEKVGLALAELASHGHTINHTHNTATTGNENASHYHVSDGQSVANYNVASRQAVAGAGWNFGIGGWNTGTESAFHQHNVDVPAFNGPSGNTGSGTPHENMPPSAAVNYIIYTGV